MSRIATTLVLGFLVNWAVCWWLASRPAPPAGWVKMSTPYPIPGDPNGFWNVIRITLQGRDRTGFYWLMNRGPLEEVRRLLGSSEGPVVYPSELLPSWASISRGELFASVPGWPSSPAAVYLRHETAAGWPFLCGRTIAEISSQSGTGQDHESRVVSGIEWKPPMHADGYGRTVLPVRPLVLGTVLNTLFYAAIIAIGCFGPRRARRWWRRRRGRCARCGYDMRASLAACPECGAPVTQFARPA